MSLQRKYLLLVNGALLAIFAVHALHDQLALRRELLRLEVRSLTQLARALARGGFDDTGGLRDDLGRWIGAHVPEKRGMEILVLDRRSMVVAGLPQRRVGKRWREHDISAVLGGSAKTRWKIDDHFHDQRPMLDVTVPVLAPQGSVRYVVHVARDLRLVRRLIAERMWGHAAWTLGALLLVALLVNSATLLWLIRPIRRLTDTLRDSRWFRDAPASRDELARLLSTVQQMIAELGAAVDDRETQLGQQQDFSRALQKEVLAAMEKVEQMQAQLVQRERLSAVGELAAGLAHELRNPLHIIRGEAELLARRDANTESCQDILEEIDRIDRFIGDLLAYTRPADADHDPVELLPVLRSVVSALEHDHPGARERVTIDCDESAALGMDADHLRQITRNLLANALEALADGDGGVRVSVTQSAGEARIVVDDTGRGITPDDLPRIFELFFTRREAGTGLGLAIVGRLVELYGGQIDIESQPGRGTRVTLSFDSATVEDRQGAERDHG
jgi:signal transduction histidine kinase